MHHFIWTKKDKRLIITLSCLIGFIWIVIIIEAGLVNHNKKVAQAYDQTALVIKAQIQNKQEKMNYQAQKDAINSPNPSIRQSSRQIVDNQEAIKRVGKINKILFTFASAKEYRHRKRLVKPYVENDVLKDQNFFAPDKDTSGRPFINNAGLHYQFVSDNVGCGVLDGDQIPILFKVVYNYWFTDYNKVQVQQVYSASYNIKTKKVSKITKLSNLSETKLNN